jgi:hypothetical protein
MTPPPPVHAPSLIKRAVFVLLLALLFAGCDETLEKMEWSPDGKQAAVLLRGDLCLSDAAGVLSAPLAGDVISATWLPDGSGLIGIRSLHPQSWKEAVALLSSEEATTLEQLALAFIGFLEGALEASDGSFDEIADRFLAPLKIDSSEKLAAILACVSHTQAKPLKKLIGKAPKKQREQLERDFSEIRQIRLQQLFAVRFDGSHSADLRSFLCTADALSEARPSPDGRSAAFVREGTLQLIALESGAKPFNASQPVIGSIAWEKDGKSVAFASPTSKWEPGKNNLSTVTRIEVAREADEWKAAEPVKIAQICSPYLPRVRALPDGSLIFASVETSFPSLPSAHSESSFFVVSPGSEGKKPMKKIKCDGGLLPADLSSFAPSPDGKQLAIVDGEGDAVRLLTVETGSVQTVWPKDRCKSRTLPAWRGARELFFVGLPKEAVARPEWMQWSAEGGARVFSGHWEEAGLTPLLFVPPPE